jgi:hypothetical protein
MEETFKPLIQFFFLEYCGKFEAAFDNQGPHLRTPTPGFNPGYNPPPLLLCKRGLNSGLNPGFGVLRCGLMEMPGIVLLKIESRKYQSESL